MKTCSRCGEEKPLEQFRLRSPNETGAGRPASYCRSCEVDYKRELRARDPEKAKEQDRKKYEKYAEKTKAKQRAAYADNPEKFKFKALWSRYRLTPEDFEQLMAEQNGVCGICEHETDLTVDHDHKCCPGRRSCGKCIRGLLFIPCNQAIGLLRDDPLLINRAAKYLE